MCVCLSVCCLSSVEGCLQERNAQAMGGWVAGAPEEFQVLWRKGGERFGQPLLPVSQIEREDKVFSSALCYE